MGDNLAISLPLCEIDPLSRSSDLSEQDITERIAAAKQTLGEKLLILGHHYQRDSIVAHADLLGDSFLLSKQAAESSAEYIVFCGGQATAEEMGVPFLGRLPFDPGVVRGGDDGVHRIVADPEGESAQAFAKVVEQLNENIAAAKQSVGLEKWVRCRNYSAWSAVIQPWNSLGQTVPRTLSITAPCVIGARAPSVAHAVVRRIWPNYCRGRWRRIHRRCRP